MLVLLSPSKSLDPDPAKIETQTKARFPEETAAISGVMKKMSPTRLRNLMSLSDKLTELNYERFQAFDADKTTAGKQAILAFKGDVYVGLDAKTLEKKDLDWAHDHVRILSGMYGVLRPYDTIQPYRLEMGTRLKIGKAKNLYAFWGDKITHMLNDDLETLKTDIVINLASNEYFKAVDTNQLRGKVINIRFLEMRNGKYRFIQFIVKKARGWMCRYIIENRIKEVEHLQGFDTEGFLYNPEMSSETELVFTKN